MTGTRRARLLSLSPLMVSALLIATCSSGEAPGGGRDGAAVQAKADAVAPDETGGTVSAPVDRDAALRAAGYEQRGGVWMASCETDVKPVPKDSWYALESAEFRDLNGDGKDEAIVSGGSSYCFGNTGLTFKLLARSEAGWKVLTDNIGIPVFHPRKGIDWPDIEIGGPGSDCFPFLRWNGRGYVYGGRSLQGRICELAPAFDPKAVKAMKAGVPMAPGLWASTPEACEAVNRGQRDPDFVYDGKAMMAPQDALTLAPIRRLGNKRFETGKDYERQVLEIHDPEAIVVRESVLWSGNYLRCSSSTQWDAWAP
jgi:hypothetical protein